MSDENDKLIEKLIAERDRLLAERPELKSVQKEFERRMEQCKGDQVARATEAYAMLGDICKNELLPELESLKESIDEAKEFVEEIQQIDRKKKTGS